MGWAYEKAVYDELGYDIAKKLNDAKCKFVVNVDTLQYSFTNCSPHLEAEILEVKRIKGENSILREFIPIESVDLDDLCQFYRRIV